MASRGPGSILIKIDHFWTKIKWGMASRAPGSILIKLDHVCSANSTVCIQYDKIIGFHYNYLKHLISLLYGLTCAWQINVCGDSITKSSDLNKSNLQHLIILLYMLTCSSELNMCLQQCNNIIWWYQKKH